MGINRRDTDLVHVEGVENMATKTGSSSDMSHTASSLVQLAVRVYLTVKILECSSSTVVSLLDRPK